LIIIDNDLRLKHSSRKFFIYSCLQLSYYKERKEERR